MKTSNGTTLGKIIRFAGGVLMLPFLIVLWIFYIIARGVGDFLDFSSEFFKSPDDLGLGGFWAMQAYGREAARAEAEGNKMEALKYWKKCAAHCNTNAMLQVARHYEDPESGTPDLKQAAELYALAASYGNAEAEAKYVSLTGHELTGREKKRVQKDFPELQRVWLKD